MVTVIADVLPSGHVVPLAQVPGLLVQPSSSGEPPLLDTAVARGYVRFGVSSPRNSWGIGIARISITLQTIDPRADPVLAQPAIEKARRSFPDFATYIGDENGFDVTQVAADRWTGREFRIMWLDAIRGIARALALSAFAGLVPVIVFASWRKLFAKKQRRTQPCPRCGYDLTGLPASGACPECGR